MNDYRAWIDDGDGERPDKPNVKATTVRLAAERHVEDRFDEFHDGDEFEVFVEETEGTTWTVSVEARVEISFSSSPPVQAEPPHD